MLLKIVNTNSNVMKFSRPLSRLTGWGAPASGLGHFKATPSTLPGNLQGGRVEKLMTFWVNLLRDYKEATRDIGRWAKSKPLKAGVWGVAAGLCLYANHTNPDQRAFGDFMVRVNQDVGEVCDTIRNPASSAWLKDVGRLAMAGQLRAWNFGLLTVVWRSDYSDQLGHVKANCKYLKTGFTDIFTEGRVVDVGFLGKWWITSKAMEDYDINPEEWDKDGKPVGSQLKQMW